MAEGESPVHGWLILDKPHGLGSTQAVSAVKRCLRESGLPKTKVGHGGTLDPLASGVLPIALGEATKLAGRMLDSDKAYDFTVRFGEGTDTLDLEGLIDVKTNVRADVLQVRGVLDLFTGPIEQMPPVYSALKVDGRRAYDLARAGEEVVLKTRSVTIHRLDLIDWCANEQGGVEEATFSASVSKGTYVRSLARDIAVALGTVGHVTMLRRTKAGPFTLEGAISLDKLNEAARNRAIRQLILPLTEGLDDIPAFPVTPDQALALHQGKLLFGIAAAHGLHLAMDGNIPVALVEVIDHEDGRAMKVVRGFNLMSKEEMQ